MGKVILGAFLGTAIGLFLGWLPSYDYPLEVVHSGNRINIPLARLLHPLSMMIGAGAGAIVGALAGWAAADPDRTELPRRRIVAVFMVFLVGILGIGIILLLSGGTRPS